MMKDINKYTTLIKLRIELSSVRRTLDKILSKPDVNELLDEYNLSYDINNSYNKLNSAEKILRSRISQLEKDISFDN
jgi:hypothetical protein